VGCITWYLAITGSPLYCGGTYDSGDAWLAVPVEHYQSGQVHCGDLVALHTGDGLLYLPARDAGAFGPYCVRDGPACHDIVADLPRHTFPGPGLSRPAYIVNSQPARDRLEVER
jgi:hypothetical protein